MGEAGSATALPTPSSERKFDIPKVADKDFKEGKLLNVSDFAPLCLGRVFSLYWFG